MWTGKPDAVDFYLRASSRPRLGAHACYLRAVAGDRVLTMRFHLNVASAADVHKAVADASATAARVTATNAPDAATVAMLAERGARGLHSPDDKYSRLHGNDRYSSPGDYCRLESVELPRTELAKGAVSFDRLGHVLASSSHGEVRLMNMLNIPCTY